MPHDAFRHGVEETLIARFFAGEALNVDARVHGVYSLAIHRRRRTTHEHAWQSSMVRRNAARVDGRGGNTSLHRDLWHYLGGPTRARTFGPVEKFYRFVALISDEPVWTGNVIPNSTVAPGISSTDTDGECDAISIEEVIKARRVTSVYQPIVDLDTGRIVAYEALARGPHGTGLASPDALFAAGDECNLTFELDWVCRASALQGALDAGLGTSTQLFVNVEPASLRSFRPAEFDAVAALARSTLNIVVEITERAIVSDPAALIKALVRIRAAGMGVAIDDVGADPASLALLPFVEPDVIKLDMRLVRQHTDSEIASIIGAVRADAERRGAIILAEGIETKEHLQRAFVFGARLGQGWLYGRPGPLPRATGNATSTDAPALVQGVTPPVPVTPWSIVAEWSQRRTTTKRLLLPMSHHVEQRALAGDPCVVLSAFQNARHFTSATVRRYESLSLCRSMVGAIAAGMPARPASGVRGGSIPSDHPLAGEWTVTVVGPHDAAALIARDCGDTGSDFNRRFEYVVTHDRATVIAAARSLMQYIDAS